MQNLRTLAAPVAAVALIVALSGCSGNPSVQSGSSTPSASATTGGASTPATSASASAAALPTDCAATTGAELGAAIESLGLVLNPDWLVDSGTTPNGFGDEDLASAVSPALTCAWVSPRGPSDGAIVTTFARVPSGQAAAVASLAEAYTDAASHRSAAAGDSIAVGTTWGDNVIPDGYLEAVQAIAR